MGILYISQDDVTFEFKEKQVLTSHISIKNTSQQRVVFKVDLPSLSHKINFNPVPSIGQLVLPPVPIFQSEIHSWAFVLHFLCSSNSIARIFFQNYKISENLTVLLTTGLIRKKKFIPHHLYWKMVPLIHLALLPPLTQFSDLSSQIKSTNTGIFTVKPN